MGTISSVARYGESCWALAEDLFVKFEDRYGVGKSMSQSVSSFYDFSEMMARIMGLFSWPKFI